MRAITLIFIFGSVLAGFVYSADGQEEHWVATWAAAQQPLSAACWLSNIMDRILVDHLPRLNDQTVRMVVHSSIGGRGARVKFSNAYGTIPLKVETAHLALHDKGSAIIPSSDRALSFSGKPSFSIAPGGEIMSDPVDLEVPKLSDLVISVYIPGGVDISTIHRTALHATYISKPGDFTGQVTIPDAVIIRSWFWVASVDVLGAPDADLVVAFGDSITDGPTSTPEHDRSYPDQLARRLSANSATAHLAIVNQGLAGNQVLADGFGESALKRFDRDVLDQPGVKWVIVQEGINDIGNCGWDGHRLFDWAFGAVAADDIIMAYKKIIERGHRRGVLVAGGTLTPFAGADYYHYYSTDKEATRQAVNWWIRTSNAFDAVIDFDAAIRDPEHPQQIRAAYTKDYLHPNDAGYKAMAQAVDLSIFTLSGVVKQRVPLPAQAGKN